MNDRPITIKIEHLIKEVNIHTAQAEEVKAKINEAVSTAINEAINSSNPKKALTDTEKFLVTSVLERVLGCLSWDKDMRSYTDKGNFLISLTKGDVNKLKQSLQKIQTAL